ncbi:MAG TPA: PepSY domain-containing protein, partial [Burkholderiales bacterium]|nr:PepSY domain-containing protein [Burkholderiales bacterium]
MVSFRKFLILTHRYLGIAVCLLFVMWFVSGIAMIFARGMPGLTADARFQRLASLDMQAVKLTAAEAVEKALLERPPSRVSLLMVMDRPAYRLSTGRDVVTLFADTGEVLDVVAEADARKVAAGFMNLDETQLRYDGEVREPDQWTLEDRRALPAHKYFANDPAGTELYVSQETAEVALLTTRGSRALAWVAAIPHWMYFAPLRQNGPVWRQVVLWTSGVATVLALLGIMLGFTQYSTRYAGLMRWHYVSGVVFGVFALTWVFSGLLSMEPFFWASEGGTGERIPQALRGGALDLTRFPKLALPPGQVKEVEFLRIQGEPYYLLRKDSAGPLLVSADSSQVRTGPFSTESLLTRVKQGNPDVPIADSALLSNYDSYYHPGERKPPLPVLRVKFGDPDATWMYIDPHMSQVVARFTRRERLQRWIYHGFHSLDFNFWYYQGPAWTTTMVALNAGGALLSVIGVVLAIKRVTRGINRMNTKTPRHEGTKK